MNAQTIQAIFSDPSDGYSAVDGLRASGFRVDLSGSIDGDLVVRIFDGRMRFDEIAALVAAHQGRMDPDRGTSTR